MVSGGEDGVEGGGGGGVIFNLKLCIYSVVSFLKNIYIPTLQFNSAYIHTVLPRSL
jgi:hypothetical protein